jgi:hypothetical protein
MNEIMSEGITSKILLYFLLRRKKNTCGSGSRLTLFFSADPIFSAYLRAAAKMASVVTLIIEKTMK